MLAGELCVYADSLTIYSGGEK